MFVGMQGKFHKRHLKDSMRHFKGLNIKVS